MKKEPIVVECTYPVPAEQVWQALTDKQKMKEWYFDLDAFKPEVGFEFQFYGGKDDVRYLHLCKVTAAEVDKKLAYSWRYANHDGKSLVTFELFPEDNKTRLKLTHEGVETFPASEDSAFAKESFMEGWKYIICTSLKKFLEKK